MVAFSNTVTCALSNTGIRLSSSLPLVQVTLVAGPPVDIQICMKSKDKKILDIAISPGHNGMNILHLKLFFSVNRIQMYSYLQSHIIQHIYTLPLPEPLTAISQRYMQGSFYTR